MSNTYNIFISHSWTHSDAYEKFIKLLDEKPYFSYKNHSIPKDDPIHNAQYDYQLNDAIKNKISGTDHSNKDLNSGKFKVIHLIEQNLPIAPYDAEWELLEKGENSKIYLPFTNVEMTIPWTFFSAHFFVLILSLLYFVCS